MILGRMKNRLNTYQEDRRSHFVQDHVRGHLSENITNKEDTDNSVVLFVNKTNIVFKVTKSRGRNIVAIKIVQNICIVERLSKVNSRHFVNLHRSIIKGIIRLSIRLTRAFSLVGRSWISAETPSRVSSRTSSPLSFIMSSPAILTQFFNCKTKMDSIV
jgi:hypothetical protein